MSNELKEAAEIMLAASDGKAIEWRRKDNETWITLAKPHDLSEWIWGTYEYRIKPEPRLEPYTLETFPREAWFKIKNDSQLYRAVKIGTGGIEIYGPGHVTFKKLLSDWQHEDGSPCGKEVL